MRAPPRTCRPLLLTWALGAVIALASSIRAQVSGPPPRHPEVTEQRVAAWDVVSLLEDSGLEGHGIFFLDFGRDGAVWIASSHGLVRYDGYAWRHFYRGDGLPSDFVRCVRVAADGRVWVGTDRGAAVLEHGHFTAVGPGHLAGPSIRRIAEDPDGTLWFCCDRWPDPSVTAGLSRLRDGEWTSFGKRDGLPDDYIQDYVRDREGRRFVLTRRGLAQLDEHDIVSRPIEAAGLEGAGDTFWGLVDAPGGGDLACTRFSFYRLDEHGWRRVAGSVPGLAYPKLLATADGAILSCSSGPAARVLQWKNARFAPASGLLPAHAGGVETLAEAPDGSVWIAGYGVLCRWRRRGGEWDVFFGLPALSLRDGHGAVWAADKERASRFAAGRWQPVRGLTAPLALDRAGTVWGAVPGGIGRFDPDDLRVHAEPGSGMREVTRLAFDGLGHLWVCGTDEQGGMIVASFDGRGWRRHALPGRSGPLRLLSTDAGVGEGVLLMCEDPDSNHFLYHATPRASTLVALPLAARGPSWAGVLADRGGGLWVYGIFGLYRRAQPTSEWRRVREVPGVHVSGAARCGKGVCFAFLGTAGGSGGLARLRGGKWSFEALVVNRFAGLDADGRAYLAAGEVMRILPPVGPPRALHVPPDCDMHKVFREPGGVLWIDCRDRVLRYEPDRIPPETSLSGPRQVTTGDALVVRIAGVERFRPGGTTCSFQVAIKLDDGPWSPFGPLGAEGLALKDLRVGTHKVSARVRDEGGDEDRTPARLDFEVMPLPMQARWWFAPLALAIFAAMAALATLALLARRRLGSYARGLEQIVAERTRSLRDELREHERVEHERAALAEQLRHSQKMEAVGRLASGVSHDFNNLLTTILGNAQMLRDDLALARPTQDPSLAALNEIERAGHRAANLTRQLLTFSRREEPVLEVLELGELLEKSRSMFSSLLTNDIRFELRRETETARVRADTLQIEQVLLNLVINARDAMPKGGELTITLRESTLGDDVATAGDPRPRHVVLTVTDSGHGFGDDVAEHVFEPFFTTKPVGKGTGLGLAVVHGIITHMGGRILLRSEPGRGTTFELHLPAAAGPVTIPPPPHTGSSQTRGTETILVCEDEQGVRALMCMALQRNGYSVLAAAHATDALQQASEHPEPIQMLITDVMMPGMDGRELARRLRLLREETSVLLISGLALESLGNTEEEYESFELLQKPFSMNTLLCRVRAILEEKTAATGSPPASG